MDNNVDIELLAKEIYEGNAVVFVGAGFSLNANPKNKNSNLEFKDWSSFMSELGKMLWPQCKDDDSNELKEKIQNYLYVAQLFKERFGEAKFYEKFREAVPTEKYNPSDLHEKLLSLSWKKIITTNQDDLIERTFEDKLNEEYSVIIEDSDLITKKSNNQIIKMHGTWDRPETIVFSEEEYRNYEKDHKLLVVKLRQMFAENTILFIGFSLTDPNFKMIYNWVKDILGNYQKRAYAFVPDADISEIEYWKKRNLTILGEGYNLEGLDYDYEKTIEEFLDELDSKIKKSDIKKEIETYDYDDIKEFIWEDDNKEELKKLMEGLE